jgi:hypothetical protein
MPTSLGWRLATWSACVVSIFAGRAAADDVTLKTGATVRGHATEARLADHSRVLEIRTSSGALIVLEHDQVQQIKRSAATQKPAGNSKSTKPRLTAKQQAWMTKVRSLLAHLLGDDRDQSRHARSQLLNINDPDALPALVRYLQQNPNEELRHLYVAILRDLPGPNTAYYLVQQSLFDPSAQIREDARHALGSERAEKARALYILALKLRDANLASRAALGIQEVGDPDGDAIPYLIEALVHVGPRVITTQQLEWIDLGPPPDATGMPRFRITSYHEGPAWFGQMGAGIAGGSVGPVTQIRTRAIPQSSQEQQLQPPHNWAVGLAPPKTTIVPESDGNPAVLDTLLKLSGRAKSDFGYNRDNWRRWWANEKASRDSQKRPSDKPISRQTPEPKVDSAHVLSGRQTD